MQENISKPLVIITGASTGFGLETAKLFNSKGYPMLLISRNIETIYLKNNISFSNSIVKNVDISNFTDVQNAISQAESIYGKADLLVIMLGNIYSQPIEEWQTMINTNITGTMNCTNAVLKNMTERKHGTIINVSSICGRSGAPQHSIYSASKTFIDMVTEQVRQEVAKSNVRVMLLAPGISETNLLDSSQDMEAVNNLTNWRESLGDKVLLPIDIAQSIMYMYQLPQSLTIREFVIASTSQDK
ncbi:hypothetical protein PPL_11126 [Heterostelium album PN500]|uniref:Uncharacterized protein n=1 Tax=Heterostelium pallidum (strain ATCC 26659 / Pp 5 / PN500) TaxID=670386 RepID=D3BT05_HETP5|nr:hypothetical protein PPL_11126 [Heterostelium album PN500]EFA75620.1 hypothetical protein PPL_11126 [Heterostelium album PN500]|eukprot:XP_020427754.1 hypothetical protein PPL_11126 [Heterostelium album PN500]